MTLTKDIQYDSKKHELICSGDWNLTNLPQLQSTLKKIKWPNSGEINIQGESIKKIDSSRA